MDLDWCWVSYNLGNNIDRFDPGGFRDSSKESLFDGFSSNRCCKLKRISVFIVYHNIFFHLLWFYDINPLKKVAKKYHKPKKIEMHLALVLTSLQF